MTVLALKTNLPVHTRGAESRLSNEMKVVNRSEATADTVRLLKILFRRTRVPRKTSGTGFSACRCKWREKTPLLPHARLPSRRWLRSRRGAHGPVTEGPTAGARGATKCLRPTVPPTPAHPWAVVAHAPINRIRRVGRRRPSRRRRKSGVSGHPPPDGPLGGHPASHRRGEWSTRGDRNAAGAPAPGAAG